MGSLGVTVVAGMVVWVLGVADRRPGGHPRRLGCRMVHVLRLLVLDLSTCGEGDRFVFVKVGYLGPGST